MRSATRTALIAARAGLAYLNLTVKRYPALVFRPVNPASRTFSVSIPRMNFVDLYSPAVMAKL